jgi:hypothetical protein
VGSAAQVQPSGIPAHHRPVLGNRPHGVHFALVQVVQQRKERGALDGYGLLGRNTVFFPLTHSGYQLLAWRDGKQGSISLIRLFTTACIAEPTR